MSFISDLKSEKYFVTLTSEEQINSTKLLSFIFPLILSILIWDKLVLHSHFTLGYLLVKGSILSTVAITLYFFAIKKTKNSLGLFLCCFGMLYYSFYGIIFLDFTYCYSFLEMYLVISFFFRISKKAYISLMTFGGVLNIVGIIYAPEPAFIRDGMSFKPHIFIVSFIIYFLSYILYFNVTKRKGQFAELQDKFASIGKQSSYFFHEIKKPISRLLHSDSVQSTDVQQINNIFLNVELMLKNPENFKSSFSQFNLKTILLHLEQEFDSYFKEYKINFNIPADDLVLFANKGLLNQVFKNLIINAVEAIIKENITTTSNTISVTYINGAGRKKIIHFQNTGSTIAPHNKESIFDPFFTTKNSGTNYGLGLSFCRNIIEGHEGSIKLILDKNEPVFVIVI